jgi:adenine/guanine/hypoxanthine permease
VGRSARLVGPAIATAPALVFAGAFMIRPVTKIKWHNLDEAIPALLAMALIPITHSITQEIIWAFLSWTALKLFSSKKEDVTPALLIINAFAILTLVLE